jgi:hypothetical protein
MGVVAKKSVAITARDAKIISKGAIAKGMLEEAVGVAVIASGDSATSTYHIASVPSNARMSEILLTSPDIGTTTTADVGLYQTTENGGAVVDADFFVAAQTLKDGALAGLNVVHGNVITNANAEKMLWEMLPGVTADTGRMYDIVLTLVGAADAAGNVVVKVRYAV